MTAGEDPAKQLCFTARALAQTHPLSALAYAYRRSYIENELVRQPNKDFVDWSSNCILVGYCLRRAEESERGVDASLSTLSHEMLRATALDRADEITGGVDRHFLVEPAVMIAALDRLISTELDKRWETAKDYAGTQDWELVEEYLSWSVIHGYCLRIAETTNV